MTPASSSLRPTFPLDAALVASGLSEMYLEVSPRVVEDAFEVAKVADAFEAAVAAGMFAFDPALGERLIVRSADQVAPGGTLRRSWQLTNVQSSAVRVLLNMLEILHQYTAPLGWVRVICRGTGPALGLEQALHGPFPLGSTPPFPVSFKPNLEDSKEPLLRIEFRSPVTDADVKIAETMCRAWDALVIRGAFYSEIDDRYPDLDVEASVSGQQTYLADANTVEHLFYEFIGAAAAYDAFVNGVIRLHHRYLAVAAVEVA